MEAIMNTDRYKQRLLAIEEELSSRLKRAGATAREPIDDSTSDVADESANNEQKEEQLWKVDTDRTMLTRCETHWSELKAGRSANAWLTASRSMRNGLKPCRGLPIAWNTSNNSKSPSPGERQPCKNCIECCGVGPARETECGV